MDHSIKTKHGESIIYLILWLVVLLMPVFFSQYNDGINWSRVAHEWIKIIPFLLIFLIHNYVLFPILIFTTAYSEYALEGFKVDALDYLLKPFSFAEFSKAATKARTQFELVQKAPEKLEGNDDYLFIKSEYKIVRINLSDILYIEGMKEYIRIHLVGQKPVMTLLSMKSVEAKLPSEKFMRVHRSYIVNLKMVSTVERFRIVYDDKTRIPVSDNYKEQFQEFLDKNFM